MADDGSTHVNHGDQNRQVKLHRLFWKLKAPLVSIFLVYIAGWLNVYSVNDWVQHRVKTLMYPNESLRSFGACSNHSDPDYDKLARVQQVTSRWLMYTTIALKTASPVVGFFCSVLTDTYGRKFLFILSNFGQVLYYVLAALIVFFNLDFIYLVFANVIYGLTGVGLLAVTFSHVADRTEPGKERAVATMFVNIAIYIPGSIGAILTGLYITKSGFALPAFTAAGIACVSFMIACFYIHETVDKREKKMKCVNVLKMIFTPFAFYLSSKYKGLRKIYILLLCGFIFADMSTEHRKTIENLYLLGMPFCWTPFKIGIFAAVISFSMNFVGLAALVVMQHKLIDSTIIVLSSLLTLLSFCLEAVARSEVAFFLGTLAAGLLVVQTLCSFVTTVTDNTIYQKTVSFFNGFVFFGFAVYCLLTVVFIGLYKKITEQTRTDSCSNIQKGN